MLGLILDTSQYSVHHVHMTTLPEAPPMTASLEALTESKDNPIRVIRNSKGLSIRDAADAIGCHHQALYMNETGAYNHVLPVVLNWLVQNSDHPSFNIEMAYAAFITNSRSDARDKYGFCTADIDDLGKPGDNPVQRFREHFGLTRSAFCKTVCVSSSLMYTIENPGAQHVAASIPPSLLDVFRELKVPAGVISEMRERYGDWYAGL